MKFAVFVLAAAATILNMAALVKANATVEGVVNGNQVKGPLCANSEEIVKNMVQYQLKNAHKTPTTGEDGKPLTDAEKNKDTKDVKDDKGEPCIDICSLCKEPPKPEEKPEVTQEWTKVCVQDPPVVPLIVEHPCPPKPAEPEKPCDLPDPKNNSVDSHAELQNKILNAEIPSDVAAKMLALHLYTQKNVKFNEVMNELKAHSPFESQAPLKPVGFDGNSVGLMNYYNRYVSCKSNPTDLDGLDGPNYFIRP